MRFVFTLFAWLLFTQAIEAQEATWIKSSETVQYSSSDGKRIVKHPNGSIYVLGQFAGSNTFDGVNILSGQPITYDDVFLARYSSNGTLIWVKKLFQNNGDIRNRATDIKVDMDGNLVMVGSNLFPASFLGAPVGIGMFIAKITADANLLWMKYAPEVSFQDSDVSRRGNRIVIDQNNDVVWLTDQIRTQNFTELGGLALKKYGADGTVIWNKYITQNESYDHPILAGITLDGNGNIIVSGSFISFINIIGAPRFDNQATPFNPVQLFVAKFSSTGNLLWTMHSNYGASTVVTSHVSDAVGNVYVTGVIGSGTQLLAGTTAYTNPINSTNFVAKLDPAGNILWVNPIRNASTRDISEGADGYLYITGTYFNDMQYQSYRKQTVLSGSFVIKIDKDGFIHAAYVSESVPDPTSLYGSDSYGYQSVVDEVGNIYTLGEFRQGINWGCLPTKTIESSFYLVKHTISDTAPTLFINGSHDPICGSGALTLQANVISTAVQYKWYLPDGASSPSGPAGVNGTQIALNVSASADKQPVIVSVTDNCTEYFGGPFVLKVLNRPQKPVITLSKSLVCPSTSEIFVADVDPKADEVTWSLPNFVTSTETGILNKKQLNFASGFSTGQLTITAKNYCGDESTSLLVKIYPTPEKPNLEGSASICSQVTDLQKSIQPLAGAISYLWELPAFITQNPLSPQNTTNLNALVLPEFRSGQISVTGMGQCGPGKKSDPIIITRFAKPSTANQLSGPKEVCVSSQGNVQYTVPPIANALQYVWSVPAIFTSSGAITTTDNFLQVKTKSTGSGTINVFGKNGCNEASNVVTMNVTSYEELKTPQLEKNLCENELTATSVETPQWYKDDTILSDITDVHLSILDSGVYFVQVGNFCGIKKSNSLEVYPVVESTTMVPNVITPNGDGKNDFFKLGKSLKNSSLLIVNRWGEKVHSSASYKNDWNAVDLSSGTYYYTLTNSCLSKPFHGSISVLR